MTKGRRPTRTLSIRELLALADAKGDVADARQTLWDLVRKLYESGISQGELAEALGTHKRNIYYGLKRRGQTQADTDRYWRY